ncbi:MAG TPA: hypothetical protein VD969_13440 [Symbiobacteriaceae bacterium]|nr:hypothetical protein [Symbiobacteriaceae bacterium]
MRQALKEGLGLAEQLAALPFKTAREVFRATALSHRPLGEVVVESIGIGEGLARLPFRAASAMLVQAAQSATSLEQRVAELERRAGIEPPAPSQPVE